MEKIGYISNFKCEQCDKPATKMIITNYVEQSLRPEHSHLDAKHYTAGAEYFCDAHG